MTDRTNRLALILFAIIATVAGLAAILTHGVLYPNEFTDINHEGDPT